MTPDRAQAMRDLFPTPAPEPPAWRILQAECEPRPTGTDTADQEPTA